MDESERAAVLAEREVQAKKGNKARVAEIDRVLGESPEPEVESEEPEAAAEEVPEKAVKPRARKR